MKAQVTHPPDAILRAYGALLNHIFLCLRNCGERIGHEALHDLGDAMHNISGIIVCYGSWIDDEQYRRLYLRPFDAKWGKTVLGLEQFLQCRLDEFRNE